MATLSYPELNRVSGGLRAGKCARQLLLQRIRRLSSSSARGNASPCMSVMVPVLHGPGVSCNRGLGGLDVVTNEKPTGDEGGVAHSRANAFFFFFFL